MIAQADSKQRARGAPERNTLVLDLIENHVRARGFAGSGGAVTTGSGSAHVVRECLRDC